MAHLIPKQFVAHLFPLLIILSAPLCGAQTVFFNSFDQRSFILSDSAVITTKGALRLTNRSMCSGTGCTGHAFYPSPLQFKKDGKLSSFSTRFVFAIVSESTRLAGHGFAFAIAPSTRFAHASGGQYLGLFNQANNGNSTNHVFAIEFDTIQSPQDRDDNHVGVDINSMISSVAQTASFFPDDSGRGKNETVVLASNTKIQAWIDYDANKKILNVTIAPLTHPLKPKRPLISYSVDLSSTLLESMFIGFSSSTQKLLSEHYILGWSFAVDAESRDLDLNRLPFVPLNWQGEPSKRFLYVIAALVSILFSAIAGSMCYLIYRRRKLTCEEVEGWESAYPHRLRYKELYVATKGFKEKEVLGRGGFGKVYKGVLSKNGTEVAVKRVSQGAKQGMREFVAEVSSLGRLRHKNLVQLRGWCRRGEELLLVYDFMPNGSLDGFLFGEGKGVLRWGERFKILKGIASGLLYLHEGWEQIVVHRDVKASNVLLDAEMSGRLSDFGLARLYEHGSNPKTTHVVGTLGYMAPELSMTRKGTTSSDVFSFGALLLEVACGRRPIDFEIELGEEVVLAEFVHLLWKDGRILNAVDKRLGLNYVKEEAELVLKLGVLCSQTSPEARPSMRRIVQSFDGVASLEELEVHNMVLQDDGRDFRELDVPYPYSRSNSSNWRS